MAHHALESVTQPVGHVGHQLGGLGRIQGPPNLHEFAEISPLDELHHQVMAAAVGMHFMDRHDVGVPQSATQFPLTEESGVLRRIIAKTFPQDLDRHNLPRVAMDRTEHTRKAARPNQIQNFVVPVEKPISFPLKQAVELVVCHKVPAHERLNEFVQRCAAIAKSCPHLLQLFFVKQSEVNRTFGKLFSGYPLHADPPLLDIPWSDGQYNLMV